MEELHVVTIRNKSVSCSCGYSVDTLLGSQAKHLGYVHGQFQHNHKIINEQDEWPDGFEV